MKIISGFDLFFKVVELYNMLVFEIFIGYKYIVDRMLLIKVFVGGEEFGGIGYGIYILERDVLLLVFYLLEVVVMFGEDLSIIYW